MKNEVEVIGGDGFYRSLDMMVTTSKRTAIEVINENFKGTIRNLLAISPPMGGAANSASFKFNAKGQKTGAVDFAAGLAKGRTCILADIKKAFHQVAATDHRAFADKDEALSWYLKARNSRKRIPGRPQRAATNKEVDFVLREIQKRQGSFPAGWSKAATYFGISLPKWISRWGGVRSRMDVEVSQWGYYLTATNSTSHREGVKIQSIADAAIGMQANNMARQIEHYAKEKAKSAGFIT